MDRAVVVVRFESEGAVEERADDGDIGGGLRIVLAGADRPAESSRGPNRERNVVELELRHRSVRIFPETILDPRMIQR